jgi:hypothetical protein
VQFSLRELFALTTLCALLMAFSPVLGALPPALLCLMACCLVVKQGGLAIAMLAAASLSCELSHASAETSGILRQILLFGFAAGVCRHYYPQPVVDADASAAPVPSHRG